MPQSIGRVRVGLFEIDFKASQISRQGRRIKVQEQPFRLLTMLLERPGEPVSRAEIQARLWPADTFVSFDDGLNTAVRKLRVVFNDSADNPRFIQTEPMKGYRFIAPVTEIVEEARVQNTPGEAFKFADFELREQELRLTRAGVPLSVELKAFRVLLCLLCNPGRLVPKDELIDAAWGETAVTDNSLTRAIALLRKVLDDDPRSPRYIETVSTVGYRFVCTVQVAEDPSGRPEGENQPASQPGTATPMGPVRIPVQHLRTTAGKTRWVWVWLTGAIVVLLLAGGYWYLSRPLPPPRITAYNQITHDGRSKGVGGTDGSRVYFAQNSPNLIGQVGVNGGEIAQLPGGLPPGQMLLMDISPDGSNALIATIVDLHTVDAQWVVPVLGGAAKRLEDGMGGSFSPDGGSVIYSNLSGDIFMVHIDGSDRHKLAGVGSAAGGFRWSPDWKIIRFDSDGFLWEMSPDGSGIHRLLSGWKGGVPCCGQWTHDGGLFLFLAGGQIWALDERRSLFRRPSPNPVQLTSGPIRWGSGPSGPNRWDAPIPGRDGKTIFLDGATPRGELSRSDLKTGSPQPFLGGISAEEVSFSPDGNSVAYVAYPEGTLWRANRDGSNRMQLTTPSSHTVLNPRWSPDSKQILFTTWDPAGHSAIHRISAADGSPQWLLPDETGDMHDPNWSPDGTKILFGTGTPTARGKRGVRIVDLNIRQVTVVPGSVGKWSPRWSSDGRYIAALIYPQINHLPVFDLKLQRWLDLAVNGKVDFPNFSHDSRFIYFLRYGKDQGVFRISVTGGKEERVVDMSGWHLVGNFAYSMSLDPTDAPLVLRDIGSDDIYALTLEQK